MRQPADSTWHGVDPHVLAILLHRFWSVLAGMVTVILIPLSLGPEQQGYYFTFVSILGLQVFFELGMGQVVVQIVAHEAAHLHQANDGSYEGDIEHLARLSSLKRALKGWYGPSALLFLSVVSLIGLVFFRDGGLPWIQWVPVWFILVAATAINLYFSWKIAMVEGFAMVRNVAQLRMRQSIVGYVLMWLSLLAGLGLWSAVAVPFVSAVATAIWLRFGSVSSIFRITIAQQPLNRISWRRDILPFQWRIAVSWISGYFVFQLFTPLVFREMGAAEAGRIGLAVTVFSAISVVGMSWVNAKVPTLGMMIARKESSELLALFMAVAKRSVFATVVISGTFLLLVWCLHQFNIIQVDRLAALPVLFCLAIATVVNCAIFSAAIFMRAHREEPMLVQSVVCGVLVATGACVFSKFGVFEMMLSYASVVIFVGLPWTLWLLNGYFDRHRKLAYE